MQRKRQSRKQIPDLQKQNGDVFISKRAVEPMSDEVSAKKSRVEWMDELTLDDLANRFWLMVRPSYANVTRLCKDCNDFNYKRGKDRFRIEDDRVHVDTAYCKKCAHGNINTNNIVFNDISH